MNLALIGYRASGKTTIAKCLEEAIGWQCINTDKTVEGLFKLTIPEIVELYGWDTFREYEKEVIKKAGSLDRIILDLGGGAILDPCNIDNIKKNATVVFLDCSPAILASRLQHGYYRPPLTQLSADDEIRTVLGERMQVYRGCADLVVNTGDRSAAEAVLFIIRQLRQKPNWNFNYTYQTGEYAFA